MSPQRYADTDYQQLDPLDIYAASSLVTAHRYRQTDQLLGDAYVLFDMAEIFTELRHLSKLSDLIASLTLERLKSAEQVAIHLLDPETGQ